MIAILISIVLSASLVFCFKYFNKNNINNAQAISFNYVVAASWGFILNPNQYFGIDYIHATWFYSALFFGFLFIAVFKLMAIGVEKNGIMAVSVAQKMSLVLPVLFSIWAYSESFGMLKMAFLLLALISVYFTAKPSVDPSTKKSNSILIPIFIFIGSGCVDIAIKITQSYFSQIVPVSVLLTCIFGAAGFIGFALLFKEKNKLHLSAIIGGIVLGSFNYFATYFLMKALSSHTLESSLVFAINNMGVLLFSAFVAAIVFKEQISKINWLGISLAIIAILGLYFSTQSNL